MVAQGFPPYRSYCVIWEDLSSSTQNIIEQYSSGIMQLRGILVPCAISFPLPNPVAAFFQEIYQQYLNQDPNGVLAMKADLFRILSAIVSSEARGLAGGRRSSAAHGRCLEDLKRYIDENLEREFGLAELAGRCNVSAGSLCRIFKQAMGMPLFAYINNRRILRARRLLIETDLPVKGIATRCGFENESYFFRIFRRQMGVSPLEYRRMHQQPYDGLDTLAD